MSNTKTALKLDNIQLPQDLANGISQLIPKEKFAGFVIDSFAYRLEYMRKHLWVSQTYEDINEQIKTGFADMSEMDWDAFIDYVEWLKEYIDAFRDEVSPYASYKERIRFDRDAEKRGGTYDDIIRFRKQAFIEGIEDIEEDINLD